MAHSDAREGKWWENRRMGWVTSTLHTTSEHGVSSITTADAHSPAASSRMNWRPRRCKWTRPFRRKTKSGFCACAITFQTQSTYCFSAATVVARTRLSITLFENRVSCLRICYVRQEIRKVKIAFTHRQLHRRSPHNTMLSGPRSRSGHWSCKKNLGLPRESNCEYPLHQPAA